MLQELCIENLALFERAAVGFGPGLNVITGETGAGKSLLIDALELLLGERPRASLVRKGAKEARVEGRFLASARALAEERLAGWLRENLPELSEEWSGSKDEEHELLLARTLSAEGRTRAWINHRPATARVLRELAAQLVEIHGQNEHQRLFQPAEQTRLLDEFGELGGKLATYRGKRTDWLALRTELSGFETRARERAEREDLLRFQARELAQAKPSVEEHASLCSERELLRHAAGIASQLGALVQELSEDDGSALERLKRAERVLEQWESKLAAAAPCAEEIRAALAHLEEATSALASLVAGSESSPERLEEVETRLARLEELQRKYRTDIAGLAARADEAQRELAAIGTAAQDFDALRARTTEALAALERAAGELGKARRGLRARLEKAVRASLSELGLERASFEVRVEPRARPDLRSPNVSPEQSRALEDERRFGFDGADEVAFLLAANPGEDRQPLAKVASGGEAARIMLALRTALALRQTIPTLIFDEVDAGVGGRLGPRVGEHLRRLGADHQVLCVSHLPAIAALAERHFKVAKTVQGGRTRTEVEELSGNARIEEIADMIAGGAAHATARAEARRLLGG
ncbi:MAG: DNA repair protein RecN [Planctomycetes bacterium]|nr:DNA repair protein RecN [Planctomycetota bacterium]